MIAAVGLLIGLGVPLQSRILSLTEIRKTIQKHTSAGIVQITPSEKEIEALKQQLAAMTMIREIPGFREIVEAGLPRIHADHVAGMSVDVHYDTAEVRFISIYVPVLNLREAEIPRMWTALYEIVGSATGSTESVRDWLPIAVQSSFDAYANERRSDRVIERVFNGCRVVVWGVPPDMWEVYIFIP